MSSEHEETTATETAAEEAEEHVDIDINASLLEVMVRRTEILEKALEGKIDPQEALRLLESIPMPSLSRRGRRKK